MHSTITSEILKSDADDTLLQIPQDLRPYLTTTERPHEIYHLAEREHDRRVRLLLRRFTNQIQYGCTNPRCNVPTCLSYRKRASPGPLRPHTDLTARALAVKCLEQYATHGRDLGRYSNRDKGKKKQSIPDLDGLCWSEPVVPWYTDPNEYLTKKSAVARKRSNEGRGPPDPTFTEVISITTATRTTPTTSRSRIGEKVSSEYLKGDAAAELLSVGVEQPPLVQHVEENKDIPALHPESACKPRTEDLAYANGHVGKPLDSKTKMAGQRHDQASLAQSLFKHPKLQLLERPPEASSPVHKSTTETQEEAASSTASIQSPDSKLPSPAVGLLHSSQSVATFRILPPRAIEWFKKAFAEYRERDSIAPKHLRSFLNQSLFFVLSDPTRLLRSASTWNDSEHPKTNREPSADANDFRLMLPSFKHAVQIYGMIVQCLESSDERFHITTCLLQALQHCYQLPHYIKQSSNLTSATRRRHSFLSNSEVAHLVLLTLSMTPSIGALFSNIQRRQNHDYFKYGVDEPYSVRARHVVPGYDTVKPFVMFIEDGSRTRRETLAYSQYHNDASLLRESIADLISHRIAIDSATEALLSKSINAYRSRGIVAEITSLMQSDSNDSQEFPLSNSRATQMLNLMQMVVFAKWDRTPVVRRTGPIGGALEVLKGLFIQRRSLTLDEAMFYMDMIPAALDEVEMPYEWLSFKPDATKMHILQFSFLFKPSVVVRYFRSLNLKVMKQSHEKAMAVYANGKAQLLHGPWTVANIDEVLDSTRAHMARFFVMTIRRSQLLEDAIGQIWQRERQELLRPLKVTLGKDEGENGLDHGGVQQEFFRIVFAEAFDPQYGMFDVDSTSHTAWFKPGSLEQLYKYEALGILMSLAIYNGVTLPITMPLAFYRKILGLKVKTIDHIEDGWPEIAKSFKQLLAWDDGDVEDILALNYEFSYDAFGKTVTVDMSRTRLGKQNAIKIKSSSKGKEKASPIVNTEPRNGNPSHKITTFDFPHLDSDSDSDLSTEDSQPYTPTPVTNANRNAFVRSYITYLTNTTIQPQFSHFLRGLHTLLSPTALSLFTPYHLKLLFEGHPTSHTLSVPSWRSATKYEDFTPDESLITWFWEILEHDLTQTQLRKLLEFVTASNRLPVSGWEGVTFIVQRNGVGDDRLPGSSTCYGRLLLPEYSTKEVLKERLIKAVEEGLGFGMI